MKGQSRKIGLAAMKFTDKQIRKATITAARELGATTPVDTGLARGNWQVTKGAPAQDVVGLRSLGSMLASAAAKLAGPIKGSLVYITNNLPYIGRLNAGSSTQAPSGFIEAALRKAIAAAQRMK